MSSRGEQQCTLDQPGLRLLVLQLALPHYRQGLIDQLDSHSEILFASGDRQAQPGVVRGVAGRNVVELPNNWFFLRRRLIWVRVPVRPILRVPILAVELNPRVLNTWLILIVRRLLRRRTIAWGHVFPRQGQGARTEWLRSLMRRMLDGMIVYTRGEAAHFKRLHPRSDVYVAANAVYSEEVLRPAEAGHPRTDFVLIGRLVSAKKPLLAVRAFKEFVRHQPSARLIIVGSGAEREAILAEASKEIHDGAVVLAGEITQVGELSAIFSHAVAMVAAGYVGLNATQSVGFGVPVIYPDDEPHAPEAEILDANNSWRFQASNSTDLRRYMEAAWAQREHVAARGEELSRPVRDLYSTEAMAQAFVEASK